MRGLLILLCLGGSYFQLLAQAPTPQKVLFVGNSYTYFWNLPQAVAGMAASQSIPLSTQQSTAGGTNLGQHWRGERGLKSVQKISEGGYDAVILQDHSLRATEFPDSLLLFGREFGALIRKHGAKPYLYMTWAREWDPYMQTELTETYLKLAAQIEAEVVPVGLAWQRARELRPGFPLYDSDGSHPSTLGTYLSACVFFGVLTGQSPVGLPERLTSKDQYGEKLYLNIQSKQDAIFCQKVAEEVITEFNTQR